MKELHRFLRHAIGPFVVFAVAQGWLPEEAQEDTIEAVVIGLGFVLPFVWSWALDRLDWR